MEVNSDGIFSGPWVLTGNTAKVKVICELMERINRAEKPLRILDIGCVGLQPLQLWEPLLESFDNFELVGIDIRRTDRATEMARKRGWKHVQIMHGSGYQVSRLFQPESFDIAVATQVLEHIARPLPFMAEITSILRPNGEVFLTIDSAYWRPRFTLRYPVRFLKNTIKKILAIMGNESHYDLPWYDHEIISYANKVGLQLINCRYYYYYNLHPLKHLHNHVVPASMKNGFLRYWFTLEEILNTVLPPTHKRLFTGLYVHLKKPFRNSINNV